MRRLGSYLAAILMAGVLIAPLALVVVTAHMLDSTMSQLDPQPSPAFAFPERVEQREERPALVKIGSLPGERLVAPAWSGTVTAVAIAPGALLETGSPVLSVNRQVIVATATQEPFARPLKRGDRGSDVVELQRLLMQFGYESGEPDGVFGSATARAVRAWRTGLGDSAPVDTFDPSMVIWLPTPRFEIAEVSLTVGTPVPPAGSAIAAGPARLSGASVTPKDGVPLAGDAKFRLIIGAHDLGNVEGDMLTPAQSDRLAALIATGDIQPSEPATAEQSETEATKDLTVDGLLRADTVLSAVQIPASAVIGTAPSTCVLTLDETGEYVPVPARVIGGALGVVYVEHLDIASVVANPIDVAAEVSCS